MLVNTSLSLINKYLLALLVIISYVKSEKEWCFTQKLPVNVKVPGSFGGNDWG
jgi:hypothetical protein